MCVIEVAVFASLAGVHIGLMIRMYSSLQTECILFVQGEVFELVDRSP